MCLCAPEWHFAFCLLAHAIGGGGGLGGNKYSPLGNKNSNIGHGDGGAGSGGGGAYVPSFLSSNKGKKVHHFAFPLINFCMLSKLALGAFPWIFHLYIMLKLWK